MPRSNRSTGDMKTPQQIITPLLPWGSSELADRILRALEANGYVLARGNVQRPIINDAEYKIVTAPLQPVCYNS